MKKSFFFALIAVLALTVTGCSATLKTIEEGKVHFELNSNDYVLSQPVTGEATVTRVLGIDWARLFTTTAGFVESNASIVGVALSGNEMYAIYDLLEKNPGYDFVFYPQTTTKTVGVTGIFTKTDVKVTARLAKLKK